MQVDVLLGLQWGDEGKGKIVDVLAPAYDLIARFQGGPNAGHTLVVEGKKIVLHTIPSGIMHADKQTLIGSGVVIDPITLAEEVHELKQRGISVEGRLKIAKKAHLILPTHRMLDAASEAAKGNEKIGSTLRGIGPAYMDKTGRNGLRVGDIFSADFESRYNKLKEKHLDLLRLYPVQLDLNEFEKGWMDSIEALRQLEAVDGVYYVQNLLKQGRKILAEGAQGSMLDIDFGTYPYVTSSNTVSAGVLTGLGLAPQQIGEVIGISKAYCTRVGSGPFPTELHGESGEQLRKAGNEFGATTGRPRRCGWIDLPALQYAIMINGVTRLALTKIDVLDDFDEIKACVAYHIGNEESKNIPYDMGAEKIIPILEEYPGWKSQLNTIKSIDDFPVNLERYLKFIESRLEVPVKYLSTGPGREELVLI